MSLNLRIFRINWICKHTSLITCIHSYLSANFMVNLNTTACHRPKGFGLSNFPNLDFRCAPYLDQANSSSNPNIPTQTKINFFSVFTSEGICHAFNPKHPGLQLKDSPYLRAFTEVFGNSSKDYVPFNITGFCYSLTTFQLEQ